MENSESSSIQDDFSTAKSEATVRSEYIDDTRAHFYERVNILIKEYPEFSSDIQNKADSLFQNIKHGISSAEITYSDEYLYSTYSAHSEIKYYRRTYTFKYNIRKEVDELIKYLQEIKLKCFLESLKKKFEEYVNSSIEEQKNDTATDEMSSQTKLKQCSHNDLVEKYNNKNYSQDKEKRQGPDYYDCSSLVKHFLIDYFQNSKNTKNLPDTTRDYDTACKNGTIYQVSDEKSLKIGDMLWKVGHVAVYIGENQVLTAQREVKTSKVYSLDNYKKYFGIMKIYRLKE